jgi:hypothetical protein
MFIRSQKTRIRLRAAWAQWRAAGIAGLAAAASILTLVLILGQASN